MTKINSQSPLKEKIILIINKVTENDYETIVDDAEFFRDLNISSLEYIGILVEFEMDFKMEIQEELLVYNQEITFCQFVELMDEQIRKKRDTDE